MNDLQARNEFKTTVKSLLARMKRAVGAGGLEAYSGEPGGKVLEHTTRRFFLDDILKALGWTLGPEGDMAEEARIKADTTIFMDYVGVSASTRSPLFVVEAKAWDKPFVAPKEPGGAKPSPSDLIIRAIEHLKKGGAKDASPVIGLWHDYLDQVLKYVSKLKAEHDHDLVRVLLTSGPWMVIFERPTETFLGSDVAEAEDFILLREDEYVERSTEIFDLLGRHAISADVPPTLRPAQLLSYIKPSDAKFIYHGLHVRYEASGSSRFVARPRILIYPAIVIQRADNVLLQVLRDNDVSVLDTGINGIEPHLLDIEARATNLLAACYQQLGIDLPVSAVSRFPGFPSRTRRARTLTTAPALVDDQDDTPDEWMLLTGEFKHYLRQSPRVKPCSYHSFEGCKAVGQQIGVGAVSVRNVNEPRVFFTDTQDYHCAHVAMKDLKDARCRIFAIDEMTCCQACVYLDTCWSQEEQKTLPCGL